jgi:hypothetical protein
MSSYIVLQTGLSKSLKMIELIEEADVVAIVVYETDVRVDGEAPAHNDMARCMIQAGTGIELSYSNNKILEYRRVANRLEGVMLFDKLIKE